MKTLKIGSEIFEIKKHTSMFDFSTDKGYWNLSECYVNPSCTKIYIYDKWCKWFSNNSNS